MSVYVRDRKTGRNIDSSYFVKDGDSHDSLERYHIGDTVSIGFPVTDNQARLLLEAEINEIRPFNGRVHIQFTVVERNHGLFWKSVGSLQSLASSLALQATSGEWEDVFKWFALGEQPEWVSE